MNINDQMLDAVQGVATKMESIKTEHAVLADRLLQVEQKREMMRHEGNSGTGGISLGAMVQTKFAQNEESFRKHKTLSLEIETKSIGSSLVGDRGSISPTPGADVLNRTLLSPKLGMKSAGALAALIYPRRSVAITGAGASSIAENAARPQSQPIYVSTTQNLVTVGAYAELSETALRTTGELQSVIDLHLTQDILKGLDSLLIAGGTNFTSGLLALATADVLPFAGTNALLEEHIAIEAMAMRSNGYQPDIVVVNPIDWRAVYLRRGLDGFYVHTTPLIRLPPLLISGMQVVFSSAVTTQTALLIDSRYTDFMPNENVRIELAYTGSQFTTGEITVRGELQGLPVVRDLGAITLVSRAAV